MIDLYLILLIVKYFKQNLTFMNVRELYYHFENLEFQNFDLYLDFQFMAFLIVNRNRNIH